VKKGEIGMNLHAGTPMKGLAMQDRPFCNIYRTESFGDDLEDSGRKGLQGSMDIGHI
jgi:hypothetical protein